MTDTEAQDTEHWREVVFGRNPRRTLIRVWIWTISIQLMFHAVVTPITVSGSSMLPTYRSGSRNLVNRLSYLRHRPQRGDVVVIDVGDPDGLLIKRIIALPGERVAIEQGRILVNGAPLRDAYACEPIPCDTPELRLGDNDYFYIGDNRTDSVFGTVPLQRILGPVMF